MQKEIVQIGDPVLRTKAKEVLVKDIKSAEIQAIIANLKDTLKNTKDGIGLASPQIGETTRIFVIADSVYKKEDSIRPTVFINPIITKKSSKKVSFEEGCLSIRGVYGHVRRPAQVTVVAYDEHGEKFERGTGALLARVIQHELDHLDGVLFTDKADDIWKAEKRTTKIPLE